MSELTVESLVSVLPWRCFHCGFVTNDPAEAEAHFGDRDDASEFKPICRWWAAMDDTERKHAFQDIVIDLRRQERENDSQRVAIEGLTYQVDGFAASLRSYKPFRECSSMYEVFCAYDSTEGRAIAAEKNASELYKTLHRALELLLAGEEGEHTPQTREIEEVLRDYRGGSLSERSS